MTDVRSEWMQKVLALQAPATPASPGRRAPTATPGAVGPDGGADIVVTFVNNTRFRFDASSTALAGTKQPANLPPGTVSFLIPWKLVGKGLVHRLDYVCKEIGQAWEMQFVVQPEKYEYTCMSRVGASTSGGFAFTTHEAFKDKHLLKYTLDAEPEDDPPDQAKRSSKILLLNRTALPLTLADTTGAALTSKPPSLLQPHHPVMFGQDADEKGDSVGTVTYLAQSDDGELVATWKCSWFNYQTGINHAFSDVTVQSGDARFTTDRETGEGDVETLFQFALIGPSIEPDPIEPGTSAIRIVLRNDTFRTFRLTNNEAIMGVWAKALAPQLSAGGESTGLVQNKPGEMDQTTVKFDYESIGDGPAIRWHVYVSVEAGKVNLVHRVEGEDTTHFTTSDDTPAGSKPIEQKIYLYEDSPDILGGGVAPPD